MLKIDVEMPCYYIIHYYVSAPVRLLVSLQDNYKKWISMKLGTGQDMGQESTYYFFWQGSRQGDRPRNFFIIFFNIKRQIFPSNNSMVLNKGKKERKKD